MHNSYRSVLHYFGFFLKKINGGLLLHNAYIVVSEVKIKTLESHYSNHYGLKFKHITSKKCLIDSKQKDFSDQPI
jgi:hypothetical protein